MANGRFSRGVEVIADASMAFVGNIDQSVEQIVNSTEYDLFLPLPPAVRPGGDGPLRLLPSRLGDAQEQQRVPDRSTTGSSPTTWPRRSTTSSSTPTATRRSASACGWARPSRAATRRASRRPLCAFLKILHPADPPSDAEFEEYVAYAVECRRRVKEQMNKRKPDDEFAQIDLSYFTADGKEVVVYCPESRHAAATQSPVRKELDAKPLDQVRRADIEIPPTKPSRHEEVPPAVEADIQDTEPEPKEQHFTIMYGDTGYSYESILGPYLRGAKELTLEDPYIRLPHQIQNFVRFCEMVVKAPAIKKITLITGYDDKTQLADLQDKLGELKQSLLELDVLLDIRFHPNMHDREIRFDHGWVIKIGRGLDFYQTTE